MALNLCNIVYFMTGRTFSNHWGLGDTVKAGKEEDQQMNESMNK